MSAFVLISSALPPAPDILVAGADCDGGAAKIESIWTLPTSSSNGDPLTIRLVSTLK